MEIREAALKDVDAILRIRRLANQNPLEFELTSSMLVRALSRHCKAFLLVNDADECVGFSMADKVAGSIWGLFVWEPYQGKGYGKLLLKVACDWLFKQRRGWFCRKIKLIRLTTQATSSAAKFYQSLGWEAKGQDERGDEIFEITHQQYLAYQGHQPNIQILPPS